MIVPVPEAEPLVGRWRAEHDHSAINGAPAHITLLTPFVPVEDFDQALDRLESVLSRVGRSTFCLGHVGVFPHVSWLAPEPASLFRELTELLVETFPNCTPYGGVHRHVVPHLTVLDGTRLDVSPQTHLEFAQAADAVLPLAAELAEVQVLAQDEAGRWECHASFLID